MAWLLSVLSVGTVASLGGSRPSLTGVHMRRRSGLTDIISAITQPITLKVLTNPDRFQYAPVITPPIEGLLWDSRSNGGKRWRWQVRLPKAGDKKHKRSPQGG